MANRGSRVCVCEKRYKVLCVVVDGGIVDISESNDFCCCRTGSFEAG